MHLNKKQRPKISVYIALSIDGYIARKDDSLDWLGRVGGFDEDYGFQQMLAGIDALIIGRKTYEIASTVPDPYPGKRVIVLSNSLDSVKAGMELYKGDLAELAVKLYREGVKHIWVDGGSTISQFLDLLLVDEMTLSVIPIVLGSGLPLFHTIDKEIPCRLVSSQSYRSGLVQQHYEIIKQFTESQDKIHFKIVDYGTDEYKKAGALREEILRKPLGLFFTKDELEMEKEHVHTHVLDQMYLRFAREVDVSQGLESLDLPVLLAYGRFEFLVAPVHSWDPLRSKFKNLTVRIFEKSAHSPQYEEAELFDAELLKWLEET